MFDYSLLHWTSFFTAAILLNIAPGPDIAFILGQTIKGGRRAGFAAMFGIWAGAFVHVILAVMGLTAILATSAVAFSIVKWIGAAYLIWLGYKALKSTGGGFINDKDLKQTGKGNYLPVKIFRQGAMTAILNPKTAIFFLAFLPQFIVPGAGPVAAQVMLHGCLIIIVAAFVEPPLILLAARLVRGLRNNERFGLWLDRSLGALFIGLGVRLALIER